MAATEYLTTPARVRTPRSAWAAALANLTGLGLGYAYLRRPLRVVAAVVGTLVLLVIAFVTDAPNAPWLWRAVAAIWLGGQAVDGARIARSGPRPPRGAALLPIWGAGAAVTVLVAGYLGYGAAERTTFATAVAAQARGDCATATPAFDAVTGRYRLTLADDVLDAAARRAECAAYTAASMAQDTGAVAAAEDALRAFRHDHRALGADALRRRAPGDDRAAPGRHGGHHARGPDRRSPGGHRPHGDRGAVVDPSGLRGRPVRGPGAAGAADGVGRRRAPVRASAVLRGAADVGLRGHAARGGDRRDRGHRPPPPTAGPARLRARRVPRGPLPAGRGRPAGPARRLPEQRGCGPGPFGAHRGERRAGHDRSDPRAPRRWAHPATAR